MLLIAAKQLAQVVCKERQLNFVFVHVVEDADVLANDGDRAVLHGFAEELRALHVNEVVVQNVHDGVALVVQVVQVRNALGDGLGGAQAVCRVGVKLAKPNVGAELVGQLQRNGQPHDFEFFQVVDEDAHRPVAHLQRELRRVVAHFNAFAVAYFAQNVLHALRIDGVDFKNDLSRLQVVNDFLHVGARRNKAHVVPVLVNAVAKHLLALFVDGVHVVQEHELFFAVNEGAGLAKYFHVGAVVLDALVLQAVQHHDVVGGVAVAVVLANDGIYQRRFPRPRVPDNEQIQFVHLMEGQQQVGHDGRQLLKLGQSERLVLVDKRVVHGSGRGTTAMRLVVVTMDAMLL